MDIGIAVDTEGGLIVPVLRNVGERSSHDLRAGLDRMRADAKARSIPPEELRGATITLSNFGMIGGRFASLVVVPPQVAIIGAGRIGQRVVAHEGQPAVRVVLPLSLTFDHRVVNGGEAARFPRGAEIGSRAALLKTGPCLLCGPWDFSKLRAKVIDLVEKIEHDREARRVQIEIPFQTLCLGDTDDW